MNTDAQNPQNEPAPPAELQNVKEYLRENGFLFAVTAAIAIAIVIGVVAYRTRKESSVRDAAAILNAARTPKDLETVIQQHASTPYAPLAMLKLAKLQFNAGDYDRALALYVEFRQKYPKHPMADGAELDRIFCLEARGQTEEALKSFGAFSTQHPDHFLTAQAMLGQARCLEQLGRYADAKTIYEDFIAAHPDSGWTPKAQELLTLVVKRLKGGKDESDTPAAVKTAPLEPPKSAAEQKQTK